MKKIVKIATPFSEKNRLLLFFILVCFFDPGIKQTYAQEVISTNGGFYKDATVQLDWTVGELVTATITSGNNTLTQGFHQSNLNVTSLDQIAQSGIKLKVYPNPVSDRLILEIEKNKVRNFSLKLFDISGKLLFQKGIEQSLESVDMQVYVRGCYFLRVYSDYETPIQTFKVIKN